MINTIQIMPGIRRGGHLARCTGSSMFDCAAGPRRGYVGRHTLQTKNRNTRPDSGVWDTLVSNDLHRECGRSDRGGQANDVYGMSLCGAIAGPAKIPTRSRAASGAASRTALLAKPKSLKPSGGSHELLACSMVLRARHGVIQTCAVPANLLCRMVLEECCLNSLWFWTTLTADVAAWRLLTT